VDALFQKIIMNDPYEDIISCIELIKQSSKEYNTENATKIRLLNMAYWATQGIRRYDKQRAIWLKKINKLKRGK